MKIRVLAASVSLSLGVAMGLVASPATAATPALIGSANGVVGLSQTVEVRAPKFAGQTVALNFTLAGQVRSTAQVALNGAGSGSAVWTPTDAGAWTITGSGTFSGASASSLNVAGVPTTTTLYASNQVPVNVATRLTAIVTPTAGTSSPTGSVVFADQFGTSLATVALASHGQGAASATYSWTPTATNSGIRLTATYSPGLGVGGSANALASSGSNGITVSDSAPLVSLTLPGSLTVGTPTVVGAVINQTTGSDGSPITGSVAFSANANGAVSPISGSVTMAGNRATAAWTPTTAGNQIITGSFSATNSYISGVGTQAVNVLAAPGPDPISIGVQGEAAWPAGGTVSAPANASISLFTTTGSGAPSSISESGPCLINGLTLITATAAGTCTLTVSSPGTGSFAANESTVTINVKAPAKKKRR